MNSTSLNKKTFFPHNTTSVLDEQLKEIFHPPLQNPYMYIPVVFTWPLLCTALQHLTQWSGFLLRAGNRLFLLAVQVNVTACFTEIFTKIIQRMFVCSKVKSHCVYGKILLSPSNQCCENISQMLPLWKYIICWSNPAWFCQFTPRNDIRQFVFSIPLAARGNPPIIYCELFTKWCPHVENNRKVF